MPKTNPQENLTNVENLPLPSYQLNPYRETKRSFERPRGKKLTIPDQSLTIKEILQRHTRGQRIPDQIIGYYDDENDPLGLEGINIETLDLSQKYDLLKAVQNQSRNLRSRYEKEQNATKLSKLKEEIAKEINKQNQATQHIDS